MLVKISIIYIHQLWADALQSLLDGHNEIRVSQVFPVSKTAIWSNEHDSISLLEVTYPDANILKTVKFLKSRNQKVIVVGYLLDNEFVEMLLNEGLDGYVLKTCCKNSLFDAISKVDQGTKYFCGPVTEVLANRLKERNSKPFLTDREKDVLIGLVSFKRSNDIAELLNISEATVRTHRKNLMRKFGSKNYIGLLRYACREGILDSPGEKFCLGCKRKQCSSAHSG